MSEFTYNLSGTATSLQSYGVAVTHLSVISGTPMPVGPGHPVEYRVNTVFGPSTTQQLVVVVAEEDYGDIVDSDRAMADARVHGARPWRQVRKSLGL